MTPLPPDLQRIADDIDAADRAADTLVAGLTEEEFHWRPDGGGGWSIAQCLDHLAVANRIYGDAIRPALAPARRHGWTRRGPLAPGFFARRFLANLEPPVKLRMKAPGKIRPGSTGTRADILRAYRDAHESIRQLVRDCADIDGNRATFTNPFLSILRFKVSTGLHVIPAHDRRHLWQAERVKARLPEMKEDTQP